MTLQDLVCVGDPGNCDQPVAGRHLKGKDVENVLSKLEMVFDIVHSNKEKLCQWLSGP